MLLLPQVPDNFCCFFFFWAVENLYDFGWVNLAYVQSTLHKAFKEKYSVALSPANEPLLKDTFNTRLMCVCIRSIHLDPHSAVSLPLKLKLSQRWFKWHFKINERKMTEMGSGGTENGTNVKGMLRIKKEGGGEGEGLDSLKNFLSSCVHNILPASCWVAETDTCTRKINKNQVSLVLWPRWLLKGRAAAGGGSWKEV